MVLEDHLRVRSLLNAFASITLNSGPLGELAGAAVNATNYIANGISCKPLLATQTGLLLIGGGFPF